MVSFVIIIIIRILYIKQLRSEKYLNYNHVEIKENTNKYIIL